MINMNKIIVERSKELDKKIVDYIVDIFKKHECTCAESVADDENIQCLGNEYLANIAEMLNLHINE